MLQNKTNYLLGLKHGDQIGKNCDIIVDYLMHNAT